MLITSHILIGHIFSGVISNPDCQACRQELLPLSYLTGSAQTFLNTSLVILMGPENICMGWEGQESLFRESTDGMERNQQRRLRQSKEKDVYAEEQVLTKAKEREGSQGSKNGDVIREEAVDGSFISVVERAPELSHQLCTSPEAFGMPTPPHRIRLEVQPASLMVVKGRMSLLIDAFFFPRCLLAGVVASTVVGYLLARVASLCGTW